MTSFVRDWIIGFVIAIGLAVGCSFGWSAILSPGDAQAVGFLTGVLFGMVIPISYATWREEGR